VHNFGTIENCYRFQTLACVSLYFHDTIRQKPKTKII